MAPARASSLGWKLCEPICDEQFYEWSAPVSESVANVEPSGEYLDEFLPLEGLGVVIPKDFARTVSRVTADVKNDESTISVQAIGD